MGLSLALFNDITNRKLVKGLKDAASFVLPELSDQDDIAIVLKLFELNPGGGSQAPFSVVSPSGIDATIAIGAVAAGGVTVYASQTSFTVDGEFLVGNLNLNTSEMATALTGLTQLEATFCIVLTDADGQDMTYQGICRVKKALIRNGTPATIPGATYYTSDQINAIFARKVGLPGETITFIDSTNTYGRIIGVNTDGSAMDDSYTI